MLLTWDCVNKVLEIVINAITFLHRHPLMTKEEYKVQYESN